MRMSKSPSLVRHVIVFQVFLLSIFFAVAVLALIYEYRAINENLKGSTLFSQAEHIRRYLKADKTGRLELRLPESLQHAYSSSEGLFLFSVQDASGKVLFNSRPNDPAPLYNSENLKHEEFFQFEDFERKITFFGAGYRYAVDGKNVFIQVAQDEGHHDVLADSLAEEFFEKIIWFIPFFFLSLITCSVFVLRNGLMPLKRVSSHAAKIGPENAGERLPIEGIPSEILPLVKGVNEVLDRLEQGFNFQRRFTADAAHELRTPLAVLLARIDSLEPSETTRALKKDVQVMSRLTSQLLKAAQMEAAIINDEDRVDLHKVMVDVIGLLTPLALKNGKSLELVCSAKPLPIKGNSDVLFNMVRNLVENALSHTPKGTLVTVHLDDHPSFFVRDQGMGVSEENKDNLFKRFWRAEKNAYMGAGLGLSIVAEAVRLHHATIDVFNHQDGGAVFKIVFPGENA